MQCKTKQGTPVMCRIPGMKYNAVLWMHLQIVLGMGCNTRMLQVIFSASLL